MSKMSIFLLPATLGLIAAVGVLNRRFRLAVCLLIGAVLINSAALILLVFLLINKGV